MSKITRGRYMIRASECFEFQMIVNCSGLIQDKETKTEQGEKKGRNGEKNMHLFQIMLVAALEKW